MGMLDGAAIVVTGAGAGLGRAYAEAVAAAGARLVVNDVDHDALADVANSLKAAGHAVEVVAGSVSDWGIAERLITTAVDVYGSVDGVVNNAAVFQFGDPRELTEEALRTIVDVNVLGSSFVALHAYRVMREQGRGSILNVVSGAHVGIAGMTAYGLTKGAVASLTYNLAVDAAGTGVSVMALSPVAQTGMGVGVGARADGVQRPQPARIAPAVVYLISERGRHLNGQVVRFDSHSLSLMELPNYRTERITDDIDTAEGIGRAFETRLSADVEPVGLY
ncbi:SDR family oxidoreductase [Rhodococcus sp. BP-332]|uniref:SDR family NAD(P)-dependent oxidoreductase n=1 Tax=Rhodococcus sp. BP-332 TaxID=2739447 RepID=UPI001C9A6464|nr:SDR family oxidoreductase [Rhodococcus sp. BP-332]MBY6679266.1 SDR family oxidoreductase [Rhodococcus sp. BP-332]